MISRIMLVTVGFICSIVPQEISKDELAEHAQKHIVADTTKTLEERQKVIDDLLNGTYRPLGRTLLESWKLENDLKTKKQCKKRLTRSSIYQNSNRIGYIQCPICLKWILEENFDQPCIDCGMVPEEF
ncbi:hypothetical protein ACFL5V_12815 [Fibrobacterota bacterium]